MDTQAMEEVATPIVRERSGTTLDNAASTSDTDPTTIAESQSLPQTISDTPTVISDSQSSPQTTVEPTTTTETKETADSIEVIAVAELTEVPAQSAQELPETLITKQILSKKLCGICTKKEAKYKCSRCTLPFCSVACSIIHKANHPPLDPQPTLSPKPETEDAKAKDPRPGTVAAAGHKGPFAALNGSTELQELFKTYPRLPSLLEEINNITLPPTNSNQNGFKGGYRRKEESWNADVGLKKGVEALNQARNSSNKDGKSLREYSRLVLQILSSESEESASDLIQREQAEENARIIERLLQGER